MMYINQSRWIMTRFDKDPFQRSSGRRTKVCTAWALRARHSLFSPFRRHSKLGKGDLAMGSFSRGLRPFMGLEP